MHGACRPLAGHVRLAAGPLGFAIGDEPVEVVDRRMLRYLQRVDASADLHDRSEILGSIVFDVGLVSDKSTDAGFEQAKSNRARPGERIR